MNVKPTTSLFSIRNVRMFLVFRVFFNSRFYYPVFTILFLDFGLTLSQFAVLNAVWAGTIVLMEVPSGALADTIGRRNLLVLSGGLMVVEIALICFVSLGNATLVFSVFLMNRIISGMAEAAASGADEAICFDTLKKADRTHEWGRVLEWQTRLKSAAYIGAMSIGAAIYDPDLMGNIAERFGMRIDLAQTTTMRFPLYLTLGMALVALYATLRMREVTVPIEIETKAQCSQGDTSGKSSMRAFRLIMHAVAWIVRSPFALMIILFGMLFDHVIRMIITMSSQYYRLIGLPEASFGLIGSGMALLGFVLPGLARRMTEQRSPVYNLGAVALLTLLGLVGITRFIPIAGLIPVVFLTAAMYLTGFFVSHYLNHVTDSHQRATVLSFKGLSFNLAYGLVGILYSLLLAMLRSGTLHEKPGLAGDALGNLVFIKSMAWFPGYFLVVFFSLLVLAGWRLRHTKVYSRPLRPVSTD